MPFPSVARLAQEMGLSEGQVRSHLRMLEKKGILKRNLRTGKTTEFDMSGLIEKLESEKVPHWEEIELPE